MAVVRDPRQCRFCLEFGDGAQDPLIDPCECRGTVRWVHWGCLRRWATLNPLENARACGLCRTPFRIAVIPVLEVFPDLTSLKVACLQHTGLISFVIQYLIFMTNLNDPTRLQEPLWSSLLLSHTLVHSIYVWAFCSTWSVRHTLLYLDMARQSRLPLMLAAHAYCLYSFLFRHEILSALIIDILLHSYWGIHLRLLQRMNREILLQN